MTLSEKIESKQAHICIIGLGYTGLPLAVQFAEAGYPVSGVDTNEDKITSLKRGKGYIGDVDDGQLVGISFTTSYKDVMRPDIIFICVPTPINGNMEPDLSCVKSAAKAIGENIRPGQLVILQSTVYPGVTENVVRPLLEWPYVKAGVDFALAYSPARINPGDKASIEATRVVGGLTLECTKLAADILSKIVPVHAVSSPRVAEMVKLYENIFRNVNIAFADEMAILCDKAGLDVWEVIEGVATKPFGLFSIFYPGPGIGGDCIPVNPYYLRELARKYDCAIPLVDIAVATHQVMPHYVVKKLNDLLGTVRGKNVLLLGASFKPNVDDARHSPAAAIAALLLQRDARVAYNDPRVHRLVISWKYNTVILASQELTPELLASQDCVVVVQAHTCYDWDWIAKYAPLILDTRNVVGKGEGTFYKVRRKDRT